MLFITFAGIKTLYSLKINIKIITMKHTKVKDLLNGTKTLHEVKAKGWVRTFRNNQFIALNDGSTINNIQCVVDFENTPEETLKRITTGAAVSLTGTLVESKGAGQTVEIQVTKLEILGDSDPENIRCSLKSTLWSFYVRMLT
jgi:asparaginyl-tRNA synthetase